MTTPTITELYAQIGDMMANWQRFLDQQMNWQAGPSAANDLAPPDNNPEKKGYRVMTDAAGNKRQIMTPAQMEKIVSDAVQQITDLKPAELAPQMADVRRQLNEVSAKMTSTRAELVGFRDAAASSQSAAASSASAADTSKKNAATSEANALASKNAAASSASDAQKWASNPENSAVTPGKFSSMHHAIKAEQSASVSSAKSQAATESAALASAKAADASAASGVAAAKAGEASASANISQTKAEEAASSASVAVEMSKSAKASSDAASASAASAKTSETTATTRANAASQSATTAQKWAANPVDTAVSPGQFSALHHATKADASASAAAASAATATQKADEAGNSATVASDKATLATTKATEAAASAKSALDNKNAAGTSASSASASATTATQKAGEAGQSASAAAKSASDSAASAAASKTQADAAAASAKIAQDAAAVTIGGLVEAGEVSMASGDYPPPIKSKSGSNVACFWKVTTAGVSKVGGIDYEVGDTLVYSSATNSYYKIDSTDAVASVNNKKGAVVLTAADVEARPDDWVPSWSEITGKPETATRWPTPAEVGAAVRIPLNLSSSTAGRRSCRLLTVGLTDNSASFMVTAQGDFGQRERGWYFVSVATRGSVITINTYLLNGFQADPLRLFWKNTGSAFEVWGEFSDYNNNNYLFPLGEHGATYNVDNMGTSRDWTGFTEVAVNRIYTTNDKPTAADVGARPVNWVPTWDDVTGKPSTLPPSAHSHTASEVGAFPATVTAQVQANPGVAWSASSGVYTSSNASDTDLVLQLKGSGSCPALQIKARYKNGGLWYRSARDYVGFEEGWTGIFTSKHPPTASDVRARPDNWVPSWGDVTGKPETFPAASHSHSWGDVTGKPTTFPPSTHSHTAQEIGAAVSWSEGNTDCNELTVAGFYNVAGNAPNWPFGASGGAMIVMNHGTYITQLATHGAFNSLRIRTRNGSTWSAWDKVYSTYEKPTAAEVGAADLNHGHARQFGSEQTLSTEDLDTIKTPGVYAQHANANTSAARHYPENLAGSLTVTVGAGVQQRYHVYNTSRVWTRAQYDQGAWTPWALEYNTLNKPTAADVGAAPAGYGLGGGSTPMGVKNQFLSYGGKPATNEVPTHGAGWQSTYNSNRRAQLYVAANGDVYSRFSLSDVTLDADTAWAIHYTSANKPTSADVGLGSVNNWGATAAVNDDSDTKYATAGAVKKAYDLAAAALPSNKADVFKSAGALTDLNVAAAAKPGFFQYGPGAVGAPMSGYGHGLVVSTGSNPGSGNWYQQIVFGHDSKIYTRRGVNSAATGAWARIYTTDDKPSLAELGAAAADHTHSLREIKDSPYKEGCDCATTANLASAYANGSSGVGATLTNNSTLAALVIDGVTCSVGMRVLVKNQTSAAQNGIYTVTKAGSTTEAWVLTRSPGCDTPAEAAGAVVTVDQGTENGGLLMTTEFKRNSTIGSTAMNWCVVVDSGNIGTQHHASGVSAGTYRSVTVNSQGHVTGGSNPTTLAGYGITDAAPSGHVGSGGDAHANATGAADGFMSAADKKKLDGIAAGANSYSHPGGDGNLHVPATGTGNNGKFLMAGATAGSLSWQTIDAAKVGAVPVSGGSMSGALTVNNEIRTTSANSLRMVYGNYGTFWRQDGSNLYLMFTNASDQYGGYNSLRPMYANLANGSVGFGHNVDINGQAYINTGSTSWIDMRSSNAIQGRSAVSNAAASAIVRQEHADRHFILGGLGNSQFGIYMINKSRTANGTDAAAYLGADGTWYCNGNASVNDVQIRSDIRLKSDFKEIADPWDFWKLLRISEYTKAGARELGFVAQDFVERFSAVVTESPDDKHLSLRPMGVLALAGKVIQEMQKRIEQLEAANAGTK
ncbi:tail fiber domain-containing protein [Aeromonas veronii]|uniref:phage tail fiber protein n=1 Tax=Aeromonas veronii TaxID=654 RepID=UPI003D08A513